jgi:uncharacterized RDD family membrane protein YckC
MTAQLVTGEAVALDLQPAALPSRLVAALVDLAGQGLVLAVFGILATAVSFEASEAAAQALGIVLIVLVFIVYPVTFETLLRGRTPGKAVMGLRVVRDDGGPVGFRQSLVRGLAGAFLERPGVTVSLAGVVTSLLNPQGKRLGDLLAGTVVIRERVSVRGGTVASMPPQLAGWAAQLDLSGVTSELALSVRQFVSRADQLTPAAREELGGRLVAAVTSAVGPAPAGTPGWAVLAAVLAERRRREEQRLAGPGAPTTYAPPAPPGAPAGYGQPRAEQAPGYGRPASAPPRPEPGTEPRTEPQSEPEPPTAGPGGFVAPF